MLHGKAARATGTRSCRITKSKDLDTRSGKAHRNIGVKPRGTSTRGAAPASSVEARLKQAGREAFGLLGGED